MTADDAVVLTLLLEGLQANRWPNAVANILHEHGYTIQDYESAVTALADLSGDDPPEEGDLSRLADALIELDSQEDG